MLIGWKLCIRSDKVDDALRAACQSRRMSYLKVKGDGERDVIYLVFSQYLYLDFIIVLLVL